MTTTQSFALNKTEKRIISLAALGGMLEFYDFIISVIKVLKNTLITLRSIKAT